MGKYIRKKRVKAKLDAVNDRLTGGKVGKSQQAIDLLLKKKDRLERRSNRGKPPVGTIVGRKNKKCK